jgi:hypothetical protein
MSPIDQLLPRLSKVRRTGPGKWIALCPTREERTPSLAIRELEDGTLLLHDFGGASVQEIVHALGLRLSDLFPEKQRPPGSGSKPVRRPFSAADLIELAAFEAGLAALVVSDVLSGTADADIQRLIVAAARLADVMEAIHGRP